MPRRPSLTPKQDPTKAGTGSHWYVTTPGSMTPDGSLRRSYFPSEKDADKLAKKLRAQYAAGIRHAAIDPILARDAASAAELLKGLGVSLTDAARAYAERVRATGTTETFRERYDKFLAANEMDWSNRYRRDMEKLADKLPPEFMKRRVAEITEANIQEAAGFRATGATAIDTRARHIRAAIASKPKPRKRREVKIFSADQVTALLGSCKTKEETRAVALMLFAGVRPDAEDGELVKLTWEDVTAAHIYVSEKASKTGAERLIPIRPRLRRLLEGHPKTGKIVPAQWRKTIQRIRKDAGIDGSIYQDGARHTFASNHLVAFGEDATKDAMGHTAESRTLFKFYRRAITAEAGATYFKITT